MPCILVPSYAISEGTSCPQGEGSRIHRNADNDPQICGVSHVSDACGLNLGCVVFICKSRMLYRKSQIPWRNVAGVSIISKYVVGVTGSEKYKC